MLKFVKLRPKIGIVGLGMVGEPLKRYFEMRGFKRGKNLFCFDSDSSKNYNDDARKADMVFVAVPTPSEKDGSCNTSIVESVVRTFAKTAKTIVIKSTIAPGTAEILAKKYKCPIVFNPEFLTEARAWENFISPDRQIVAPSLAARKHHAEAVLNILPPAPFSAPHRKKAKLSAEINPTEAELGKYAANVFGALKVSFANIIYDFAKAVQAMLQKKNIKTKLDYENVRHILANDARIGGAWLDIGRGDYRGYGGYCFTKDTDALLAMISGLAKNAGSGEARLLKKGLAVLCAMRDYNRALLAFQRLSPADVSRHDKDLSRLIKKIKKAKNKL